jgi:hypothetical protein
VSSKSKHKKKGKYGRKKIDWEKTKLKGALRIDTVFTVSGRSTKYQTPSLYQTRYAGKCKMCEEKIEIGEWISKSRAYKKGMVHPKCIGKDNELFQSQQEKLD